MNRAEDSTEHEAANHEQEAALPAARQVPSGSLPDFSAAPAFHSDDVEHVANYRALSVLALISLVLGLASPLSILSKAFLLLPVCGIAVSLFALRRIALSEGRLAGRGAAMVGLALCIACGATAVTRTSVARYLRTRQAEVFARDWLAQIISNDLELAFKSTYEGARPPAPPQPGTPTPALSPYETFSQNSLIQSIAAAGKNARIQYVTTLEFIPQTRQDFFVRQQFSIIPASDSAKSAAANPIAAYLTIQRSRFRGDRNPRWLVTDYESTKAPDM